MGMNETSNTPSALLWFPVWGHALCFVMMLVVREWEAAFFAASATYFAFCWIAGVKIKGE